MIECLIESASSTLVDFVRLRAREQSEQHAYTFLLDGETEEAHLSYGELDWRARTIAGQLQQRGLSGSRVLLLCPTGLDYIASFFGCLYAGAIAVPAYPPNPSHLKRSLPRLEAIAASAQPAAVIASSNVIEIADQLAAQARSLHDIAWIASDVELPGAAGAWSAPDLSPDSLAFLQYTSGSTSTPKGVMVSHGNLLHNLQQIYRKFRHSLESKGVIWLPPYHDMGLIGGILQPLYAGFPVVLMSPVSFLQQPLRWLQAISRYGATTSGGPNFAYDLCVRKITPEQRATLDLSSWNIAFNGAEPIRADVLDRFTETFEPCGFRREAWYPTYGLAEATLIVSGADLPAPPLVQPFAASALQERKVATGEGSEDVRLLIGCGRALEGQQIAIVDPDTGTRCAPDHVGEIWVSGPSVAQGYWGLPTESAQTFGVRLAGSDQQRFLRTGDLGFLHDGQLFITGRLKDLMIIRGRNHYPQDIERTVEQSHPGLRAGSGAAFSLDINGEERVVVVQEVDRQHRNQPIAPFMTAIRGAVAEEHEIQLYTIVLIRPGSIPKTSSGKIQRHLCREGFVSGTLTEIGRWVAEDTSITDEPDTSSVSSDQLRSLAPHARRSYLEHYLRQRVAQATGIPASDLDTSAGISTVGLDSLTAIELQYAIEQDLGVPLSMARLLGDGTLAELAGAIAELLDTHDPGATSVQSNHEPQAGQPPLSHGQRGLWLLHQLAPTTTAYTIARAVRLIGADLNLTALHQAFQLLVDRHAALRTTFKDSAGEPYQVIDPELPVCFQVEDAGQWSDELLRERLNQEALQPFDLLHGPLLRVFVFRRSADQHVLLLVLHHLIADLQSLAVLVQELGIIYSRLCKDEASALPKQSLSYVQYVARQTALLASPAAERLWDYWQSRLGGNLPTLDLPLDRPRPATQTYRGAAETVFLEPEIVRGLKAAGHQQRATLFMTLVACFGVLLHRYTGQEDLLVGTPTTGRSQADLTNLVGYFINPVPLRLDLSGAPTFDQLLQRTRHVVLGAFAHQDYPFDLLVSRLRPNRDLRRSSLIQAMFVMQHTQLADAQGLAPFALELPGSSISLGGVTVEPLPLEQQTAQFDLTLAVAEVQGGLGLVFNYNSDLFDAATIKRMAGHFANLVTSIAMTPGQTIDTLPLLTADEHRQLIAQWSPTAASSAREACLHQLFELQAAETPDAIALVAGQEALSYGELNRRANQLAHYLQERGVGPDTLVGLCMERSPDLVVAILATLKAGGAYLPIDPIYPHERLRFMLEDAQAPVLIIQEQLVERAAAYTGQMICWERDAAAVAQQPDANPQSNVSADHLAYVIYTSGSTGKPKGSMISHANVTRLFAATEPWFKFGLHDVWTLFHSYAFDFSVWEIWGALLHGGRLLVVPQSISRSPDFFYRLISSAGVTVLNQTPSAFRQLIEVETRQGAADELALRLIIFGGEALELQSLRPWIARHGDQQPQIVNMYGITETTVHVTYRPVGQPEITAGLGSMIGGPIPDLRLYILDQHMQPVPVGVPGELYVGGAGLARGYLRRPELTAERFVPDPFAQDTPGARLYRTGDLARSRADGDIEYLGRIDQQVKLRGFRIELGEIESVLRQHPGVRDLAVLAAEVAVERDAPAAPVTIVEQAAPVLNELRPFIKSAMQQPPSKTIEQRLIAYIVADGDTPPTVSELRRFLHDKLPDYMIPAVFVFLPSLPITEHGKLDRKALPTIDGSRPLLENAFVAPATAIEQELAGIWQRVLGIEQVGIHDNFFELGGDSILSIQVRAQAEAKGLHFSLQQLFGHQTIAELARVLSVASLKSEAMPETAPFSLLSDEDRLRLPADIEDAYPLARMQAGVIFHCQLEPQTPLYHDIFMYRIKVHFDEQLFRQAVQELIDRHAVLRTSFNLTDYSEPLQLVHAAVSAPFLVEDLRSLPEDEQHSFQAAWVEEEKARRFAWETAPLIRFHIHRIGDDVCDLILSFHDTIFDGWSTASLLTELMLRYDGHLNGRPRSTEPPLVTYRDFVAQERRIVASEAAQQFWREALRDGVVTPLSRWPQVSDPESEVAVLDVPIAAELSDGLKDLARKAQVPLKHVLLAAHMKVISLLAGQDEIISGLETNGRLEAHDGEKTIGVHLNMVPFRVRLAPGSWIDVIRQIFAAELEVVPFRHYPLAELQRERRGQPWFETVFNYTHFHVFEELRDLQSLEVIGGRGFGQTHFTLLAELNLNTFSGQIQVDLVGNLKVLSREQLTAIGGYYASVLRAMVVQPAARHETYPLLSEVEQSRQLVAWNNTQRDYPHDRCVHELIEEQAARTPDAVAVMFGTTALTYHELNQRANVLARQLQALGVAIETRVAICLERSAELIVALLGVLKAGAAYVPLDPAYPQERLRFMLDDSRAAVIIAEESTVDRLPNGGHAPICRIDQLSHSAHVTNSTARVSPDNLCYIIYTSGSTGRPKGVQISHRALVNCLTSMQHEPGLSSHDRLLAVTTLSFDIAGLELYLPLISGATVVLAPKAATSDGSQLAALLAASRATVMQATPATWRLLLAAGWQGSDRLKVLCGGEALPPELARQLLELGVELWNMYGPTETTIWSAVGRIDGRDEPITVGRPIANTEIYILDRWLQPVPVGVIGDLYIGGDGLARGYFGQPALTAEKWIPHPFSHGVPSETGTQPGARLYAVGDRARYLPDGRIEILGRSDQQIKLRGFRIELGEIEAALTQHPAVREAAVLLRDERLVAYVVKNQERRTENLGDESEAGAGFLVLGSPLREFLAQRLPEYMIPSVYVMLDRLPLTPNGKIDRRALPVPEGLGAESTETYVAPRTPIEEELAKLWTQIFGATKIGIHNDFFTLGGHSLLATQLIIHARNRFHVEIPIAMLFTTPTIAGMATVIEQLQAAQESADDLERMLDELDQLSDEDVRARLLADF